MDTIVLTHDSALEALRSARRATRSLPWPTVDRPEQRRVLRHATANARAVDFEQLEAKGLWREDQGRLHMMVASPERRRCNGKTISHLQTADLPEGSLLRISRDTYCVAPALVAAQMSYQQPLAASLMLLLELLGTYVPARECCAGQRPMAAAEALDDPAAATCYHCEPVLTMPDLRRMARWVPDGENYRAFRTAANLAAPASASPAESIAYALFSAPKQYGGFGCGTLPGGMQLNQRVEFSEMAVHMASGMPYAICDAYIPAARTDIEYNGVGHEQANARIHDTRRNNGLRGMGIRLVVIDRRQMGDIVALEAVARSIFRDAGVRFRYQGTGYRNRQSAWLNGLRAAVGMPAR